MSYLLITNVKKKKKKKIIAFHHKAMSFFTLAKRNTKRIT